MRDTNGEKGRERESGEGKKKVRENTLEKIIYMIRCKT